jgi:hypothetical protein
MVINAGNVQCLNARTKHRLGGIWGRCSVPGGCSGAALGAGARCRGLEPARPGAVRAGDGAA